MSRQEKVFHKLMTLLISLWCLMHIGLFPIAIIAIFLHQLQLACPMCATGSVLWNTKVMRTLVVHIIHDDWLSSSLIYTVGERTTFCGNRNQFSVLILLLRKETSKLIQLLCLEFLYVFSSVGNPSDGEHWRGSWTSREDYSSWADRLSGLLDHPVCG